MARVSVFNSPLLLGFDHIERLLDQISRSGSEGYPPYNIERISPDLLRITFAVAGFGPDDLSITLEENQLSVCGKLDDGEGRNFLHRGIAARQFQRSFVLAEGIEVVGAKIDMGLLHIDLERMRPEPTKRVIEISAGSGSDPEEIDVTDGAT